ncbi:MAG: galactose-1-phosphate uridylyltransferase [Candidatus Altiarchaeota archaeon]|nr:galactose-1-phosphate uridylyltransferase [Candidatus Altiarchaeota archaeon]
MNQLRKDYLMNKWVIIAKERGKRPGDFRYEEKKDVIKKCFFCPGNEHKTPPEIGRVEKNGEWIIRCFPNKFPATTEKKKILDKGLLKGMAAYGRHEVIVETPIHGEELGNLEVEHIAKVLKMYARRLVELKKDPGIEYVSIFKNRGNTAGASLAHSHTQIVALPRVPGIIREELKVLQKQGDCLLCRIGDIEKERIIMEDEHTVVFAPYASRFPFEVRITPKRHVPSLEKLNNKERGSFALSLKEVLTALNKSINYPPYNYHLHLGPGRGDFHMYLELLPRLSTWAGFELSNDVVINTMPPETAAKHYTEMIKQ